MCRNFGMGLSSQLNAAVFPAEPPAKWNRRTKRSRVGSPYKNHLAPSFAEVLSGDRVNKIKELTDAGKRGRHGG